VSDKIWHKLKASVVSSAPKEETKAETKEETKEETKRPSIYANRVKYCLGVGFVMIGLSLIINGGYMVAKAQIAQRLLAYSWNQGLLNGIAQKPWFWADTEVAARIRFLRLDQERYVMRDASGESLAFGPGFVANGEQKSVAQFTSFDSGTAIAGHRDSHFGLLQKLQINDIIEIQQLDKNTSRFRVTSSVVIDTRYQSLAMPNVNELTLITCYPFESMVPGGPLRYVVFGEQLIQTNEVNQSTLPVHKTALKRQHQTKPHYTAKPAII
jgi:sortase A